MFLTTYANATELMMIDLPYPGPDYHDVLGSMLYAEKRRKSEERKYKRRLWEGSLPGVAHLQGGIELAPGTKVMYRGDGAQPIYLTMDMR